MVRWLGIVLLLLQMANAKTLSATYEVSFGLFQKMGIADATFQINDNQTYAIRVEAKTVGLAKVLSNNRYEVYESKGIVKNGRLIPQTFRKVRQTNAKKSVRIFTFDHPNRIVWKETTESEEGEERKNREKNDYYAQEDILSIFFNLDQYSKKRENRTFYAIGGNKKDGRIDTVFPKNEELAELKNVLGTSEGEFLKVVLHDRIFASANGELLINLDSEGLCEKAVLEDVLLFGDIVGVRVR